MTALRNFLISLSLLLLIFRFPILCYPNDDIAIQSYLMRGFREGLKPGPNPAAASFGTPLILLIQPESREAGENAFAFLRDEVSSIYQVPNVIGLTSAVMIWDGKRENLNETVLAYGHLYPIQFYPRSLKGNVLSLKLEAFKFRFNEIHYLFLEFARLKREVRYGDFELFPETRKIEDAVGGERWLEKELTLPLNEPMILVLPTGDHSYFLAIQAFKREARQLSIGLVNTKLEFFNVMDADPVCGRIVGRRDGFEKKHRAEASLSYKGYTFLFCSQECMEKFRENPERHLRKSQIKYFEKITDVRGSSYMEIQEIPTHAGEVITPRPFVLVRPAFPEACQEKGIQGVVNTELQVDDTGNAKEVRVLGPLHPELDAAAKAALRQWNYKPLLIDGKPASAVYHVDVDFKLKEKEPAFEPKIVVESPSKLDSILKKSADYCLRLEEAALNFICLERIEETIFPVRDLFSVITRRNPPRDRNRIRPDPALSVSKNHSGERNEYVYDYQLIRKDGQIIERRILVEENSQLRHNVNAYPKTNRFYIDKVIYGPIGLLGGDSHPLYNYNLLKEDKLDGRTAFVIEIKPKKLMVGKPVYGKVWLDQQDASVLKMDIKAESLTGYERVAADYESRGTKPVISIEIIYSFEKEGLRYPSRIVLKEAYSDQKQGQIKMSRMTISYDHYKFFMVETEQKIIK